MSTICIKDNYGYKDVYQCRCDNCGETMNSDLVQPITDVEMRLTPGTETPAGQCPDCFALVFVDEPEQKHS